LINSISARKASSFPWFSSRKIFDEVTSKEKNFLVSANPRDALEHKKKKKYAPKKKDYCFLLVFFLLAIPSSY